MSFYYRLNDETLGPVSAEELSALFQQGIIQPDTLVIEVGASAWSTFGEAVGVPTPEPEPVPAHEEAPQTAPAPAAVAVVQPARPTSRASGRSGRRKPQGSVDWEKVNLSKMKEWSAKFKAWFERVSATSFNVFYGFSMFLLLLSVLSLIVSCFIWLNTSNMNVPDFNEFAPTIAPADSGSSASSTTRPNKVLIRMDERIRRVCNEHGLESIKARSESIASRALSRMKEKHADDWLDGWEDCIDDAISYASKNSYNHEKKCELCEQATLWYTRSFDDDTGAPDKVLQYMLGSLIAIVVCLFFPTLLRIERNTRK